MCACRGELIAKLFWEPRTTTISRRNEQRSERRGGGEKENLTGWRDPFPPSSTIQSFQSPARTVMTRLVTSERHLNLTRVELAIIPVINIITADVIEIIDKRIKITTNTKSNIIHAIRHLQHNPSVRTYVATHRHTTSLHTLTLSVNNMNSSSTPLNSFWAVDGSVVATTRTTTSWQSSSSPTSPKAAAAAAPSPTAAIPID